MNLTTADAEKARRYLHTAKGFLATSHRKTVPLAERIKLIEANLWPGHPDYDGDVPKAMYGLSGVVNELAILKSTRPAVAGFGEPLIPNLTPQLYHIAQLSATH
jgi:hypothetical protein